MLRELELRLLLSSTESFMLSHEIGSSAHTLDFTLSRYASQILDQLEPTRPSAARATRVLVEAVKNHPWALATAALLDAASVVAPQTKKLAESLIRSISTEVADMTPRAAAEQITARGRGDILAGFFALIESLASANIPGYILVDRFEARSETVKNAIAALAKNLPHIWRIVVAANDESPEGIAAIDFIWPTLAYLGADKVAVGPLDLTALESWILNVRGSAPAMDVLRRVLSNCDGRPLFLQDWVMGISTQAEVEPIWRRRLEPYYEQRSRSLSPPAARLLRLLAVLPAHSTYSFDFCHRALKSDSIDVTYAATQELVEAQFLARAGETPDAYRLIHEVARAQVRERLPISLLRSIATDLLSAMSSLPTSDLGVQQDYARLLLSALAGRSDTVIQLALPTAHALARQGSSEAAIEGYELYLGAAPSPSLEKSEVEARLGIASVLLETGYYAEGLQALGSIPPDRVMDQDEPRILLVQGRLLLRLNQYQRARITLEDAHRKFGVLGDVHGQLEAAKEQNTIMRDLEQYSEAVPHAQHLVNEAILQEAPPVIVASCYRGLARSLALCKQLDLAADAANKALSLATDTGSLRAIGNAQLALGEAYRHGGVFAEAIEHYQQAIDIADRLANRDSELWSILGLADALLLRGEPHYAMEALDRIRIYLEFKPRRHPLEYLHWRLSTATITYVVDGRDEDLTRAAAAYVQFGINWPLRYVAAALSSGKPTVAKAF